MIYYGCQVIEATAVCNFLQEKRIISYISQHYIRNILSLYFIVHTKRIGKKTAKLIMLWLKTGKIIGAKVDDLQYVD